MSEEFRANRFEVDEDCGSFTNHDCTNPFLTTAYIRAVQNKGEPWKLAVFDAADQLVAATVGYLKRGRLECALDITSLPGLDHEDTFWAGLKDFCAEMGVQRLRINTLASPPTSIPTAGIEVSRRQRREFILTIANDEYRKQFSSNHKRNIKRAIKAGLTIRRQADARASETHGQMMIASMNRRMERGEPTNLDTDLQMIKRLLETGSGTIFQAFEGEQVLSSILLLLAESGAYYHSAGTTADGMSKGASAFLVDGIAKSLNADGFTQFNLGGTGAGQEGLARFKSGFGARIVELEAAEFYLGSKTRMRVTKAIRVLRDRTRKVEKIWQAKTNIGRPHSMGALSYRRSRTLRTRWCNGEYNMLPTMVGNSYSWQSQQHNWLTRHRCL